jgi:hypothetical protein
MLTVKAGDLFPDVEEVVTDENDVPVDITGATVKFSLRKARDPSTVVIASADGVITDGPAGRLAYRWQTADQTAVTAGTYEYLFRLTPTTGDPFHAPTEGWGVIVVEESF